MRGRDKPILLTLPHNATMRNVAPMHDAERGTHACDIYSHVMPTMQVEATEKIGQVVFGE